MNKNTGVSIIIVTRNRCGYLLELLNRIDRQTVKPSELIIVDNASSDNTKEVAINYKATFKIQYVYEAIKGISFARNAGIRAASQEIIVFIDDDCIPVDDKWLENLVKNFDLDPGIGIIGGMTIPMPKNKKSSLEIFYDSLITNKFKAQ